MFKSERLRAGLMALVIAGVFGLCGWAFAEEEMTAKQAVATSLAALSQIGVLASLLPKREDETEAEDPGSEHQ